MGEKGLGACIRTQILLRMLQCEKPTIRNMEAVHLTFQVLSVPYENRVAKPTAPELQVQKKKTTHTAIYKTAATRNYRYVREPFNVHRTVGWFQYSTGNRIKILRQDEVTVWR
jgi:hypothetical protein